MGFDIYEMFQVVVQEAYVLKPFDKGYKFYFDETNNIRKFSLNPSNISKVNAEEGLYSDFILGGVCFKNIPNCDELFSRLSL